MALITSIVDIQDSAGTSLVPPNTDGTKPLKVLRVSDDFVSSYTKSGDTGIVSLSVATSLKVDTYIKSTLTGDGAGIDVGRFDLGASGPLPAGLRIMNDDASGPALHIDNSNGLLRSQWDLQVGGSTGTRYNSDSISLKSSGGAVAHGSGRAEFYFNGTNIVAQGAPMLVGTGLVLGDGVVTFTAMSTPATPTAGTAVLYLDSGTGKFTQLNSDASTHALY